MNSLKHNTMANTISKEHFKNILLKWKIKSNSFGICPRHAFPNSCIYLLELHSIFHLKNANLMLRILKITRGNHPLDCPQRSPEEIMYLSKFKDSPKINKYISRITSLLLTPSLSLSLTHTNTHTPHAHTEKEKIPN